MKLYQGDHNIPVSFHTGMDLTDATVEVVVKREETLLPREAIILDAKTGKCEFILTALDLTIAGNYSYQWTVEYQDGVKRKSGEIKEFPVYPKQTGVPDEYNIILDGGEI